MMRFYYEILMDIVLVSIINYGELSLTFVMVVLESSIIIVDSVTLALMSDYV